MNNIILLILFSLVLAFVYTVAWWCIGSTIADSFAISETRDSVIGAIVSMAVALMFGIFAPVLLYAIIIGVAIGGILSAVYAFREAIRGTRAALR